MTAEPVRVFSTHPRERLAALDHAIGSHVRAILREPGLLPRERVRAAMVIIIAHIRATETLAAAAAVDDKQVRDG